MIGSAAVTIKRAKPEDAAAACDVLRRSIAELCNRDHHGDPNILAAWLANKTPENVAAWIANESDRVLLAVRDEAVVAVGGVKANGEITLNYVSPDARFAGVSRTMLAALEAAARAMGNSECRLVSTETARQFYLQAGYKETAEPEGRFGTSSSYPMRKQLY